MDRKPKEPWVPHPDSHPHPLPQGLRTLPILRKTFLFITFFPPHSLICGLSMMQEE